MTKKRVLFCGEASWLATGFSKFNRAILEGLHKTGKYELAEMGSYGSDNDPRAKALPWKFYGVNPNNEEEARVYNANGNKDQQARNSFGAYKIESVLLDFQPDIVFDARDPWMFAHIVNSKLKSNFRFFCVPTVDSAPQRKEFIELFKKSDVITTYSRFGKKVLEAEGITVTDVTSPAVHTDIFRPLDRKNIRDKYCLVEDLFVFGTVMRNQKRKLFPDLFTAYTALRGKYRKASKKVSEDKVKKIQHSVLFCHTSWPDVGWDIPDLLYRFGIQRHVVFTYKCDSCKNVFLSWFIPCDPKGMGQCRICGEHTAHMPNTHSGVTDAELAELYNLMDVYIQPAICEGWGLPITEAKACGVPGLYQNYSAMEDHIENGGGMEIKVGRFYHEADTMAIRSLPDIDNMVAGMEKLAFDDAKRMALSINARNCALRMHQWDTTVKKVENILDGVEIFDRARTWDRPIELKYVNMQRAPRNLNDEQFIHWCYYNILSRKPDQKGLVDWMNNLKNGTPRDEIENFFRSELLNSNAIEYERIRKSKMIRGVLDEEESRVEELSLNGVLL